MVCAIAYKLIGCRCRSTSWRRRRKQEAAAPAAACSGHVWRVASGWQGPRGTLFNDVSRHAQVPQYLLEAAVEAGSGAACSVVCTQPRRIAAISVAERVADERGEPPPGKPGSRVRDNSCKALLANASPNTGALWWLQINAILFTETLKPPQADLTLVHSSKFAWLVSGDHHTLCARTACSGCSPRTSKFCAVQ